MEKITITLLAGISAVSQILAATGVIQTLSAAELSAAIPAWQALSALSAAAAFSRAIPVTTRNAHALAFSHCFLLCLFLPVVGQGLFLALAYHARKPGRVHGASSVRTLGPPKFDPELLSQITYGQSHSDTHAHAASAVGKARALMAGEDAPLDTSARSLDRWLEHSDDEVRLMAFGMWSLRENAVAHAIHRTTLDLSEATSDEDKARLHGRLAQLHWQLLKRRLVQPEMQALIIATCEQHAQEALALQPQQAQAWFLLGSCALRSGRPQQATTYLASARQHHFPDAIVLPAMAEAAFHQRDFAGLRQALAPLRHGVPPLSQKRTLEYWR